MYKFPRCIYHCCFILSISCTGSAFFCSDQSAHISYVFYARHLFLPGEPFLAQGTDIRHIFIPWEFNAPRGSFDNRRNAYSCFYRPCRQFQMGIHKECLIKNACISYCFCVSCLVIFNIVLSYRCRTLRNFDLLPCMEVCFGLGYGFEGDVQ